MTKRTLMIGVGAVALLMAGSAAMWVGMSNIQTNSVGGTFAIARTDGASRDEARINRQRAVLDDGVASSVDKVEMAEERLSSRRQQAPRASSTALNQPATVPPPPPPSVVGRVAQDDRSARPVARLVAPAQTPPESLEAEPTVAEPVTEEDGNEGALSLEQQAEQALAEADAWKNPRYRAIADDLAAEARASAGETYEKVDLNTLTMVGDAPVSTFSIDVDTASYANVRRYLLQSRQLPPAAAVRIEEMVNYFRYTYPVPEDLETPFETTVTVHPTPWNPETRLMHVALKGYMQAEVRRPPINLVFLVDVSGSMNSPDKLGLAKQAMNLVAGQMTERDTISLVTYAGAVATPLEATRGDDQGAIRNAIQLLGAGGSTAGAAGIQRAYDQARANFDADGVNRVIVMTDGDFNVGASSPAELVDLIERERDSGVFLSVLGFGTGNLDDHLMQALAQNGNGVAAYIDNVSEAYKVLVEDLDANLFTIAKDVKIQIEFNPATVLGYRLVGYETRALATEDFDNDAVDAGDIGSGHTVTALYEIVPNPVEIASIGDDSPAFLDELAFLKLRYKLPDEDVSRLITRPVGEADAVATLDDAGDDLKFAAAVAGFAQLLRGDQGVAFYQYDQVLELAKASMGPDPSGRRAEFLEMVEMAKRLSAGDRRYGSSN